MSDFGYSCSGSDHARRENAALNASEGSIMRESPDSLMFSIGREGARQVIGAPSLAWTSMEQGGITALHPFGVEASQMSTRLPYGIHTVPEIAMVGPTILLTT